MPSARWNFARQRVLQLSFVPRIFAVARMPATSVGRGLIVAIVATVVLAASPARADIQLQASADRTQVAVGDRVIVTIQADGAQSVPAPELGDVSGFEAQYLGPSTQVSIVNGRVTASISHRYALVARQAGQFTLGPFSVEYEGKHYEAPAIRLRVAPQPQAPPAAQAAGSTEIRLSLSGAKPEAFVGERIPLVVTLYVGNVRIDQVQYPKIEGLGFVLDQWAEPKQTEEVIDGRRYRVVRFQTTVTPLHSGPLVLAPTMDMSVLGSRRRGGRFGDPFFDQFLGDTFADRQPFQARADPATVTVQPLPEAGRPASFTGAVGHFDFKLDAQPTTLDAGDPITVRMEVSGVGNLNSISPPSVPVDDRFRRYDTVPGKEGRNVVTRVFEQVVIPKVATITELPPVEFSYFDPSQAAYRTITRGPIPLTVRAVAAQAAPKLIGPAAEETEPAPEKLGRDIVYIKDVADGFTVRGDRVYTRTWFVLLQLVPLLGFFALLMYVRRRERLAADPRLVRFRAAGREVRHALATLRGQSLNGVEFYNELAAAVGSYLGAKLDLPPGAVDVERVLERLGRNGVGDDVKQNVRSLFEVVERARYAPNSTAAAEREQALQLARSVIGRLDKQRGLGPRIAAALLLAVVLPRMLGAQAQPAIDPHTSFFEANAAYKAGRYADAARAYETLVAAGVEGAALSFNLGNAYFKDGQIGRAVLNYERAERLAPRDPDIRANLAYAQEMAEDTAQDDEPLWRRIAFRLADRVTTATLVVAASLLWWSLWIVLGARMIVRRFEVGLARTAWALAVLVLVVGVSLGARLWRVDFARAAVVTARGDTSVRFEPSATGTQYFTVREGTSLQITDVREGWCQVRRRDGRRGWVPADAVTAL